MKKFLRIEIIAPVALLVIAFLTYGIFIKELGLYWDDFPYTWFGHVLGTTNFHKVFYDERPLLAPLYNLTAPIFGENILSWQIFAILMRWACALCVGWIFRLIWPGKKDAAFIVSLLFLVYPGFGQQWISTIYSRVFILLFLFLLSTGFMLLSLKSQRKYWIYLSLSIIAGGCSLLGSEYFYGLEFSRPVILWLIVSNTLRNNIPRAKKVFLHWLPYLIGVLTFSIWRGLIVQSALYGVKISHSAIGGIFGIIWDLISRMILNAFKGGLLAWLQILSLQYMKNWSQTMVLLFIVVLGSMFCIIGIISWKWLFVHNNEDPKGRLWQQWQMQAIMLGLFMILIGSLPVWAANLPFELFFPYNRFTISMMFGSALIISGLLQFIRIKWVKIILLSGMVALSAGWHFQTAISFRSDWKHLSNFLQQLTWRIPAMKPGTMLVAFDLPLEYYSNNSLTAAINWIYAPEFKEGDLPYYMDYLALREKSVFIRSGPNSAISQKYRNFEFIGNTSDVILIYHPFNGCFKVLDPVYTIFNSLPNSNAPRPKMIKTSNFTRILTDPEDAAQPIMEYFEKTAPLPWCYYYEKAELSRQIGDTSEILKLWQKTKELSLIPADVSEYSPFIEGLGFQGKIDEAIKLTLLVNQAKPSLGNGLCQIWDRIASESWIGANDTKQITAIQSELHCNSQ